MNKINAGLLAIQGSLAEHMAILNRIKMPFKMVCSVADLKIITHLIIPGGESTTITKLLKDFGLWTVLKEKTKNNRIRIFGTCAGAIICQKLGLNIKVQRNGYGAQQSSFSDQLDSGLFPGLTGVFIRAPRFISVDPKIEILAKHDNEPVLVKQNNFLAAAFHPELNAETRIHKYFFKM